MTTQQHDPTPSPAADPARGHLMLITGSGTPSGEITIARTGSLIPHPLSTRLPVISQQAREALRADITAHGIVAPIEITSDNVILDGHARVSIARELDLAGIPARIVTTDDEAGFILARALARRNLSVSQRAALAVECESFRDEIATGRARSRGTASSTNGTASPASTSNQKNPA